MAMVETLNNVYITGVLVKKDFEEKEVDVYDNTGKVVGQDDRISGNLIVRTNDGSEHEVFFRANKHKKDGGENALYKAYETVMNDYVSLEDDKDNADIVKLGFGQFEVQDYKSKKDGKLKTFNSLKATFVNRLEGKDLELNPQEAKFEVQGIITKMEQEIIKDAPTGNMIIHIDVLGYEGKIIPIKLTVMQNMVQPFQQAGFYESGVAKFTGKLVNTKKQEQIVEKQAFGEDIIKNITVTDRKYEVVGGSPQGSIYDLKLTDQDYEMAKSKRRLKLQEIINKETQQQTGFTNQNTTPNAPMSNPFGTQQQNPFMQQR